jgi:hypothetical protein
MKEQWYVLLFILAMIAIVPTLVLIIEVSARIISKVYEIAKRFRTRRRVEARDCRRVPRVGLRS